MYKVHRIASRCFLAHRSMGTPSQTEQPATTPSLNADACERRIFAIFDVHLITKWKCYENADAMLKYRDIHDEW